jgi:predicted ATP-grasp superfamily ATP-dependent carboligase
VNQTGAVVIGGDYRGLGVVRSLGRRGIPVWVLADEHFLAATSRYTQRRFRWPSEDADRQIEFLVDLGRRHHLEGWVLIPTGDETAALLSQHRARLAEQFRISTPDWDVLRWAYDKRLSQQLATRLGIAQPWTCTPASAPHLLDIDCPFPAILKPAVKTQLNRFTRAKAWPVANHQELITRYTEACALIPPNEILLQELIPGNGETQFSFAALCQNGEPLAWVVARRARQYPIDFGRSSSYVETVEAPDVEQAARRILTELRYTGLIEAEFKVDPRDGRCKFLELNPRVWGWHTLGRIANVDFPYLLWRMTLGESVPMQRRGPPAGLHWIHLRTDLPAVVQGIRRGVRPKLASFRSLGHQVEFAILAADDPIPALVDIPLLGYVAWRRRLAGGKLS